MRHIQRNAANRVQTGVARTYPAFRGLRPGGPDVERDAVLDGRTDLPRFQGIETLALRLVRHRLLALVARTYPAFRGLRHILSDIIDRPIPSRTDLPRFQGIETGVIDGGSDDRVPHVARTYPAFRGLRLVWNRKFPVHKP